LPMDSLIDLENSINIIPGVLENGLFAHRVANKILVATEQEVRCLQ